jgi:hypothetical protein
MGSAEEPEDRGAPPSVPSELLPQETSKGTSSGGPRTAQGKKISSKNATRHGINSPSPVAGGEREEDWLIFKEGIRASLGPVSDLEEELAADIAITLWQKRRVQRTEAWHVDVEYNTNVGRMRGLDDVPTLIPEECFIAPIIRYGAHLDRAFARKLNELELLQRLRSGEDVPPPIRLQIQDDRPEASRSRPLQAA